MKKHRIHLLGLVHLPQARKYSGCAFTQKNLKLAKMLTSLGHEVFYYGSEGSDVEEYVNSDKLHFIQTHTLSDIRKDYGEGDNRFEIGYDYKSNEFKNDFNTQRKPSTLKFYQACNDYILKNRKSDDFLFLSQGYYHKPIADAVNLYLTCEPGIGYRGSFAPFRVFESSSLQHFTYGYWFDKTSNLPPKGNYYDRVIPNFFDPNDFTPIYKKKDYYLYIGRLILNKGVWTAIKATEAMGVKLILAGQKDPEIDVKSFPKHCEYLGSVDIQGRKKLMGEAIATFVPTVYLEPFAGVHIESMLSGTPPITTNFGVFPETIPDYLNGKVGFRCDTLNDFVQAGYKAKEVDNKFVRGYAERFLMDNVKWEYEKWIQDLHQLYLSATIKGVRGWHYVQKNT